MGRRSSSTAQQRSGLAGFGRALCAAARAETRIHVGTQLVGGWPRGRFARVAGSEEGDRSRRCLAEADVADGPGLQDANAIPMTRVQMQDRRRRSHAP
jgi:hypothetical protein